MKISGIYIAIFSGLCLMVILIFDLLLMPIYVRMDQGRYMVNVTDKKLEYAQKILRSEGYRSLVSDTLFSASYDAILDWTFVFADCASTLDVAQPNKNINVNKLNICFIFYSSKKFALISVYFSYSSGKSSSS